MTEQSHNEFRRGQGPGKPPKGAPKGTESANGVGIAQRLAELAQPDHAAIKTAEAERPAPLVADAPAAPPPMVAEAAPAPVAARCGGARAQTRRARAQARRAAAQACGRGPARDADAGFREAFAQCRALRPRRRQGAGGVGEAGRDRPGGAGAEAGARRSVHDARPRRRILRRRREPRPGGANRSLDSVLRTLGLDAEAALRRADARHHRARQGRQAVLRSRMDQQSLFRFHQTGLCADVALGRRSRAPRRRDGPAHPRQGRLLHEAGDVGALALELPRHQPGAVARHARRKRREPRARHEDDGRGHRGRPRPVAHPAGGRGQVQARRQSGRDAGQGHLPQRIDGADPVRPDDAGRCASARC